jgi:hypothetical protein
MKRKTYLILLILISLLFLAGCTAKKESGEAGNPQGIPTGTEGSGATDPEEDGATPEYVEDYTVELKEDEVFEIH